MAVFPSLPVLRPLKFLEMLSFPYPSNWQPYLSVSIPVRVVRPGFALSFSVSPISFECLFRCAFQYPLSLPSRLLSLTLPPCSPRFIRKFYTLNHFLILLSFLLTLENSYISSALTKTSEKWWYYICYQKHLGQLFTTSMYPNEGVCPHYRGSLLLYCHADTIYLY